MFKKVNIEPKDVEKMIDLLVEKMAKDYFLQIETEPNGVVRVFVGSKREASDDNGRKSREL